MIGINPATDSVETVVRLLGMLAELIETYRIPTQSCVLAHVTTQLAAIEQGAPVDLVFQSIAGTEAANASFGVNLKLLEEAQQAARSLGARHARQQRDVLRNGPGLVPLRRGAPRRRSANARSPGVRGGPPFRAAAW